MVHSPLLSLYGLGSLLYLAGSICYTVGTTELVHAGNLAFVLGSILFVFDSMNLCTENSCQKCVKRGVIWEDTEMVAHQNISNKLETNDLGAQKERGLQKAAHRFWRNGATSSGKTTHGRKKKVRFCSEV